MLKTSKTLDFLYFPLWTLHTCQFQWKPPAKGKGSPFGSSAKFGPRENQQIRSCRALAKHLMEPIKPQLSSDPGEKKGEPFLGKTTIFSGAATPKKKKREQKKQRNQGATEPLRNQQGLPPPGPWYMMAMARRVFERRSAAVSWPRAG